MKFVFALALLLSGCRVAPTATRAVSLADVPTLPQLVAAVNANNERLPSLWARGSLDAVLYEEPGGGGTYLNGTVYALHLKPDRLLLKAEKDVAGTLFELGTDGEKLWAWIPRERTAYVGTVGDLDPRAAAELPLRPDLVLQVLGVGLIPTDLTAFPAPLLEVDPDNRLLMLRFAEPAALGEPRLKVSKQVWYDFPSEPGGLPLPRKVILSDDDGRAVLVATLAGHEPVGGEGGPVVATRFRLFFPPTGSKMRIDLDALEFKRGRGPRAVPNARGTFRFDPERRGAERVVDLTDPSRP